MKHKTLTVLLTLALALGLSCPVRADVPGERIDEWSARLSEDAQLSGAVFWTGSDYRTETCLTLAPGGAAAATVVCCEPLRSQERIREAAARLEARGLRVLGGTNGGYYTFATGLPVGIAVAGGVLGIILGVTLVEVGALLLETGISYPLLMAGSLGSILFSALIGIAGGLYPALQASRMDVVTALRFE